MPSAALWISIVAAAGVVIAPALAHFGLLRPMPAFLLWLASVLPGLAGLATGILALVLRRGTPVTSLAAIALSLLPVLLLGSLLVSGRRTPRINDVSTDLEEPPAFVQAKEIPANRGKSLEYPASFKPKVRAGYPDLTPVVREEAPAALLERAAAAAREMGWTVTAVEPDKGRFEAVVKSRLWQFEDDVVVRVRETSTGTSRLDVRSKSRDGQGDFGANAARIRALTARL